MTLIASIITFSKKKFGKKKNVSLDPRHGTLALDMEPSTLDPRQKDRLTSLLCKMLLSLTLSILLLRKNTLTKRRGGLAVESVPVRTGKNNLLQHTSKTMLLKRSSYLATISRSHSSNSLCKFGNQAL